MSIVLIKQWLVLIGVLLGRCAGLWLLRLQQIDSVVAVASTQTLWIPY